MLQPVRFPLLYGPTPCHRLDRASADLGIDLWIKRDDLTGFAGGGNKGRKLEYLIPAIQASGAEIVITSGSRQSNFIRQMGAACRMMGIRCVAVVMDLPYDGPAGLKDYSPAKEGGNVALDRLFGVEFVERPNGTWDELAEAVEDEAVRLESEGKKVYRVAVGGSSALGAYSFLCAGEELGGGFSSVVFASSSGSTQVGLAHAFHNTMTQAIGIACDPEPELPNDLAVLSAELKALVGGPKLEADDFVFLLEWVGEGYGIPSLAGRKAIDYLLEKEGILLDQVYSGKAFAGLMDLAASGKIKGKVCFWHTGGVPSLTAV